MTYEATLRMEGYLVFEYEADADVAGAGEGWEDDREHNHEGVRVLKIREEAHRFWSYAFGARS